MEDTYAIINKTPVSKRHRLSKKSSPKELLTERTVLANSPLNSPHTPQSTNMASPLISPFSPYTGSAQNSYNFCPSQDPTTEILWNCDSPLRRRHRGNENIAEIWQAWSQNNDQICPSQPLLNKWLKRPVNVKSDDEVEEKWKESISPQPRRKRRNLVEINTLLEVLKQQQEQQKQKANSGKLKERVSTIRPLFITDTISHKKESSPCKGTLKEEVTTSEDEILAPASTTTASTSNDDDDWGNDDYYISQLSPNFLTNLENETALMVIPSTLTCERDNLSNLKTVEELPEKEFSHTKVLSQKARKHSSLNFSFDIFGSTAWGSEDEMDSMETETQPVITSDPNSLSVEANRAVNSNYNQPKKIETEVRDAILSNPTRLPDNSANSYLKQTHEITNHGTTQPQTARKTSFTIMVPAKQNSNQMPKRYEKENTTRIPKPQQQAPLTKIMPPNINKPNGIQLIKTAPEAVNNKPASIAQTKNNRPTTVKAQAKESSFDDLWGFDIDDSTLVLSQEILKVVDHGIEAVQNNVCSLYDSQRCSAEEIARKKEAALRRRKMKYSSAQNLQPK